ncbi:MFS family permease [Altererythrobacter atlanticus]|uniref:Niacin/nicotinamide transporter NaiP n=1 Tax=Croceibacterium atlanticum TaxID=1267766 RepID=A0A0F7KS80_9SPHN|nr:MFS transporter [Croceibacterium atlanticum]AKH42132.1 Putative niacin/nicotinamide transporter NaiP [Croceibacterium atlanticum]MBB5733297.1 MFS family permease [Croceibacterium atlanticum]
MTPEKPDRSLFGWYREADRKTRRVFWTCGAGWVMDAADAQVYQYLIPLLITSLGITLTEAGSIASASYFAAAVGGWLGGWLCDRFGRARILQITILWFSVFSFLSGFAETYEQMLVIRVLHGIGFGAEWAVGAVLLGEMINPRHRGKALGAVQAGAPIGSGIAALLAGPVAASFDPDLGWRVAFWIGLAPALLIFFIRRGSDDAEVYKLARAQQRAENRTVSLGAIFGPGMIGVTMLASMLSLGVQGAAYSVANYLTSFMTAERGLTQGVAGYLVLINSIGGFFGCITNSYISDLAGRRTVFRIFGFGFLVMASIYLFGPWGGNLWFLVPIGMIYGFFQFGMYASFGPYFTELFPTEMRGSGQAFAYNSGRAGAALFILGVPLVAQFMPLSAAMATLGIVGIICALIPTLILPETAGRALSAVGEQNKAGNRP